MSRKQFAERALSGSQEIDPAVHDAISAAATDMWDEHVAPLQAEVERLRRIEKAAKRVATPDVAVWAEGDDVPKTLWQAIVYLADVLEGK
jgi:hypothetical protein